MTVMATNEFAVIKTGGKQYKVAVGDVVSVEKMKGTFAPGDKVVFEDVLMYDNGTTSKIGTPTLAGAKVEAVFQKESSLHPQGTSPTIQPSQNLCNYRINKNTTL
jgi:ribosomal protein L21